MAFSGGRTQFAPTVLPMVYDVFSEWLNCSDLMIGSVGNAVLGVPWDLICFHGQPQGYGFFLFVVDDAHIVQNTEITDYSLFRVGGGLLPPF
ncbi:MAG: hypothetical protein ACI4IX_02405 [Acutalibacteraceae bacterium]